MLSLFVMCFPNIYIYWTPFGLSYSQIYLTDVPIWNGIEWIRWVINLLLKVEKIAKRVLLLIVVSTFWKIFPWYMHFFIKNHILNFHNAIFLLCMASKSSYIFEWLKKRTFSVNIIEVLYEVHFLLLSFVFSLSQYSWCHVLHSYWSCIIWWCSYL